MSAEAGFGAVGVVPSESPLNVLYEIRA
jgi:hypothetical protein